MAGVSAAGRLGGRGRLYAYRVRGLGRSGVVLWVGGLDDEPDQVLALREADHLRVPLFTTVRQARVYADRRGRRLACPEADTLELGRVQHWLENPAHPRQRAGRFRPHVIFLFASVRQVAALARPRTAAQPRRFKKSARW